MGRYAVRRLLQIVPLILVIVCLVFVLIRLAPGDPITYLAEADGDAEFIATQRAKYGLDRPIPEQLATYLGNILRGDLGESFRYNRPVSEVIGNRLPATLLLMGTALAFSTALGLALGVETARRANSFTDLALSAGGLLGQALPSFWLAQVAVIVFAAKLGWFPVQGMTTARTAYTGFAAVWDVAWHLALPAFCLGVLQLSLISRLTRASLREVLAEEYVRTARAKGLPERTIVLRHALRNALLPIVTVVGGQFGNILTGAVLIEIIFAWPGIGRLIYDATAARDYPLLTGLFFVAALGVVLSNLVTDLLYGVLDPRVRLR